MTSTQTSATRRIRAAAVATVAAGASVAGLLSLGGVAQAATVRHAPAGYVVTDNCTGLSGGILYTPGLLTSTLRNVQSVMTGTLSGCSDIFNGPLTGTGSLTAVLFGKSSVKAENWSGTFTINWPASSGFNPSNGSLSVTDANGLETITGTVTSGFDTGSLLNAQYVITGHKGRGTRARPVKSQTYTNTQPLTLSRNEG